MTRRSPAAFAACAALLLLAGCQAQPSPASQPPKQTASVDTDFLNRASKDGLAQQAFARLAEAKSVDPKLRALATEVLREQASIEPRLAAFAHAKGVELPNAMDPEQQTFDRQLQSLTGFMFDRAYIERQLQMQTMTIQAFQTEADSGKDATLRSFAQQTLPSLQQNLRQFAAMSGLVPG